VVLVGVVGLELDRRPFYFKEAEFVVSCSYGPGRYDPNYEDRGHDYPPAYVRWTEQRNLQAVLDLMATGRLDVTPVISHRFPIERAPEAYELIDRGTEPYLAILLTFDAAHESRVTRRIMLRPAASPNGKVPVGVLGAGNFARMVLLPAIRACDELYPSVLCSAGGVSAVHSGAKCGFESATTDELAVLSDPSVQAVFSATRHDQHARQVLCALRQGKSIFVEKPLCLTVEELREIEQALEAAGDAAPLVMVGFNRRFSPAAMYVREFFADVRLPLTVSIRFNAGAVAPDEWVQNDQVGGGRVIGEACHGIDLATYLIGSPPVRVFGESIGGLQAPAVTDDQCFLTLRHANGSISNIAYLAGGDKVYPKERIEVFGGGRIAVIDDFRAVTTCTGGRMRQQKWKQQDKGHRAEVRAFAKALREGGPAPISWAELRAVTLASILAVQSLREGLPIDLNAFCPAEAP
jgi:predicted dehydrogenase